MMKAQRNLKFYLIKMLLRDRRAGKGKDLRLLAASLLVADKKFFLCYILARSFLCKIVSLFIEKNYCLVLSRFFRRARGRISAKRTNAFAFFMVRSAQSGTVSSVFPASENEIEP